MNEYYQGLYLDAESELEFGKYQGETVGAVTESDPDYIRWLNGEGVSFSDEVIDIVDA